MGPPRVATLHSQRPPKLNMSGTLDFFRKLTGGSSEETARAANNAAVLASLDRSQALAEFSPEGNILSANRNFLNLRGYQIDAVQGRHHRLFVHPLASDGERYQTFWSSLQSGEFQFVHFKRLGRESKEVWIGASYNPIPDLSGKVFFEHRTIR
jgi:methyl-accepting chemotaxis protein